MQAVRMLHQVQNISRKASSTAQCRQAEIQQLWNATLRKHQDRLSAELRDTEIPQLPNHTLQLKVAAEVQRLQREMNRVKRQHATAKQQRLQQSLAKGPKAEKKGLRPCKEAYGTHHAIPGGSARAHHR